MAKARYYTDEQKAELLSNPYTSRVSDCRVFFSLAFKQLVIDNIDKEGMSSTAVFRLAGYSDDMFNHDFKKHIVRQIRKEAASPDGLREPEPVKKHTPRKKHSETESRELENRVKLLEQQVSFLKKSRHLRDTGQMIPPHSSS